MCASMIKAIVLILLILIGPAQLLASECGTQLTRKSDNILTEEGQDIMLMSSLLASQLQPTAISPQITPTLLFLSAITEVKVEGEDKGIFHNFGFRDRILLTAFKRLGILENLQTFLLSQLGFKGDHLGPFSIRAEGGVIFHLTSSPLISTIINFNYDKDTHDLLDVIARLKQMDEHIKNTKRKSIQEIPTFSEYLFLALLDLNIPLSTFLFKTLNKQNAAEIHTILNPLFDDVRQTVKPYQLNKLFRDAVLQKASSFNQSNLQQQLNEHEKVDGHRKQKTPRIPYSKEQKEAMIQQAIEWIGEGVSVKEAAKRLKVHQLTLTKWLNQHEKTHGPIPGRKRNKKPHQLYSQKQKEEMVQQTIEWIGQGIGVKGAAKKLKVNPLTLAKWLDKHEEEYSPIPGRKRSKRNYATYSQKQREEIAQQAIKWIKQKVSVRRIAKILNVDKLTLKRVLDEHEEQYGPIPGRRRNRKQPYYSQEQKDNIIKRALPLIQQGISVAKTARALNISPAILSKGLDEHEKQHGRIPGRRKNKNPYQFYSQEQKDSIVKKAIPLIQQGKKVSEVARELKVHYRNLPRWIDQYAKKHGITIERKRTKNQKRKYYSQEEKGEIVLKFILMRRQGMSITEATKKLNLRQRTLQPWLDEYEKKYGPIPERQRHNTYPQEEKGATVELAVP